MTRIILLITCLAAAGCATTPPARQTEGSLPHSYSEASAAALAFDAPISAGMPHPELARGPRAPSAFFGFEEPTIEYYQTATDNLQSNEWGDFYTQESLTVRARTTVR